MFRNLRQKATACIFSLVLPLLYLFPNIGLSQSGESKVMPFISEIITQFPNVRDLAISPDEREIYFTVQSYLGELSAIVICKQENGNWSAPQVAPFSGTFHDLEPSLSPDGLRLYFASDKPVDKNGPEKKDYDIWYVERKTLSGNWSEPINLGPPVNTRENEFYPSVSKSGNLYFTGDGVHSKGKDDIFVSRLVNGRYEAPVSVSDSVNSTGYEFNAFIAPDESYLIFTCYNREGGYGSGDLYISYNKSASGWTAPENMGQPVNSAQMDYCPFVDSKNGMLYFTSKRTAVIKQPERRMDIKEFLEEANRYENGQSRLYRAVFKRP